MNRRDELGLCRACIALAIVADIAFFIEGASSLE
jgi:hypothetical protein